MAKPTMLHIRRKRDVKQDQILDHSGNPVLVNIVTKLTASICRHGVNETPRNNNKFTNGIKHIQLQDIQGEFL